MTAIAFQNAALLRRLADTANPPESIAALARDLQRDKSNTRRAMASLEDEGLLDGLALTARGRQVLAGIDVAEGRGAQAASARGASDSAPNLWPLDKIVRNPANRDVDPASIPAMADSLAAQGQLQPVTLTPVREDGTRMLLIGERRWLGAKLAAEQGRLPDSLKAGLRFEEREATAAEAIAITVVENVERQEIPPLELAFLLRGYADAAGEEGKPLDAKSVAERLGLGVRDVQDKIRIARQATPEAIEAYREHGSWDRLRETVSQPKNPLSLEGRGAGGEGAGGDDESPFSGRSTPDYIKLTSHAVWEIPWQKPFRLAARIEVGERIEGGWTYATGLQTADGGTSYGLGFVVARNRNLASREAAVEAACDELYAGRHGAMPKGLPEWLSQVREEVGLAAADPLVVNGVRYPNATRANEARRAAGILPRHANHGGGSPGLPVARIDPSLTQEEIDQAFASSEEYARAADRPTAGAPAASAPARDLAILTTDRRHARARLALIEIAHKVGQQRRPLDPVNPAEWTGDVDQDFLSHGCTCGAHWLDPQVQTLLQLGAARVVQIPGGHPPMLALTEAGLQYLQRYGCALPITGAALSVDQQIAGQPATPPGGAVAYATACLAREAAAPPEADPSVPDDDPTAAVALNDDPWDRTPEQVAEAEALLSRVLAFTCDDAEAEPTEGDTAAGLLEQLGLRPRAAITDQGGIRLETTEGLEVEIVTVDAAGHHPDEHAKALAALIAWAFERAIGGEG